MMRNAEVWKAIARLAAPDTGERCTSLLATVVQVDGSAYRKAGAMMLLREDGARVGMISGGCLEQDLVQRAREVLMQGISRTVDYDMRSPEEEAPWGVGAGCNGSIRILLEPLEVEFLAHLRRVKRLLDRGVSVTSVRQLEGERGLARYLFVPHEGHPSFGKWEGSLSGYAMNRLAEFCDTEIFIRTFRPKPRLILIGGGEDARPLAAFAAHAGFAVHVADWRPGDGSPAHFPDARIWLHRFPGEIQQRLQLSEEDSVVLMTHRYDYDQSLLPWLLGKPLRYLGILGPRRRTSGLLGGLGLALPEWAHSPAGLAIGAEGPEQIAVSILAEVIQSLHESQRTYASYETNYRALFGGGTQLPHGQG